MRELTKTENLQDIIEQEKLLIVQFGSQLCGPCFALKHKIDLWNESHPQVKSIYVQAEDFREVAAGFGVFTVPAILVFAEGRVTIRESGYFGLEDILSKIERYIEIMDL